MPPITDDDLLLDDSKPDLMDDDLDGLDPIKPVLEKDDPDLDLSLLSEDERKAAMEDDLNIADVYDPEVDDGFGEVIEGVVAQAPAAPAAPAALQAPAAAQQIDPAAPAAPAAASGDYVMPELPPKPDHAAALATLAEKETALEKNFADGEISDADYATQLKALAKEQGRYESDIEAYNTAVAGVRQQGEAAWLAAANAAKLANPVLFSPEHVMGYNKHVEAVTADPANAKLSYSQQLAKAARLYAVDIDRPDLAPQAKNPAPQGKQPDPAAKPQPIRAQPVVTLARVPAAAENDTDGDRFKALNSLLDQGKIEQHEAALARMSPEQREAYGKFE